MPGDALCRDACEEVCVTEEKRAEVRHGRVARSSSQNKFLVTLLVDLRLPEVRLKDEDQ